MRLSTVLTLILLTFAAGTSRAADSPRVVAAWAAGPLEARVAFDRPVDPKLARSIAGAKIVSGVDAGADDDRGSLRIAAARLDDDGRTLVLATDPHSREGTYAIEVDGRPVRYTLKGVEATVEVGGKPTWAGWWPSVDTAEVGRVLGGSAPLESLERATKDAGKVSLRAFVTLPKGRATVVVRASCPFEVSLGAESAASAKSASGQVAEVSADVELDVIELTIVATLDGKAPLSIVARTRGPAGEAAIPPSAFTLPWAPATSPAVDPSPVPPGLIAAGDAARGAAVFRGEQAKCATCHRVGGVGGEVGPGLDDVHRRDRAWIYRQVYEPSTVIHPDYVPYTVLLKDGRALAGIVRAEGADAIRILDTQAKSTVVLKSEVEELKPSATSIMPVGLLGPLGEQGVRDLVEYLATAPTKGK